MQTVAATGAVAAAQSTASASTFAKSIARPDGVICGNMTGAAAIVAAMQLEGTDVVFGIPGAQENELWDSMKQMGMGYLLVTHEFSASAMADGYARATGKTGVIALVPGPGITNALTGIGEALLDSVPMVVIVGDVDRGKHYLPFQVHDFNQRKLLEPVSKEVFEVTNVADLPLIVRQAFVAARSGEPGPVGVVVPYNLFLESHDYHCLPPSEPALPFDEPAVRYAIGVLANQKLRVGIYAGMGCMNATAALQQVAEMLQSPIATSVSGKGVINEAHPLAVGWGYGSYGTRTAEAVFKHVDVVLAVGVKYSEVSTASYAIPKHKHVIHVDINENNLGKIVPADVCVHSDAQLFLSSLLEADGCLRRKHDGKLCGHIAKLKKAELAENCKLYAKCGADPMAFLLSLRRETAPETMVFVDVTMTEHWSALAFATHQPRTYFNPVDNQAMGWSVPAAIGAQRAFPNRPTVTVTGDGCLMMSAMEIATCAREGLPVKFFILDDQGFQYMQRLQQSAYRRTTATVLPSIDYGALAKAFNVGYQEITSTNELDAGIRGALAMDGPVLTRVAVDYRKRPVRWIDAAKGQFIDRLTTGQQMRLLGRITQRTVDGDPQND